MNAKEAVLKDGKDKAIRNRHHWIFSGAVASLPEFSDGDILQVRSAFGDLLGSAYFNRKAAIIGRMVVFDQTHPLEAIEASIKNAIALRAAHIDPKMTNSYRLINGEGDSLPGLVVDRYNDVLVIQITTLGMEKIRSKIVDFLMKLVRPKCIYENSDVPSRREEGLEPVQGCLKGEAVQEIEIIENGLHFFVSVIEGQKTGFFLDHREMRQMVRGLSQGRKVLNCFAYTGGFSVYAAAGRAKSVASVDISDKALAIARRNIVLNNLPTENHRFYPDDVFDFFRKRELDYDLIILDPPAFVKKRKDIMAGCRGYKDINRLAIQKIAPKSLLLTCSCSYFVDVDLFQKVVFQASVEAGRHVRIIGRHQMALDHPVNICHPESDYLKSLLLYVE